MDFDEKDALETKEELESLKHKLFMENVRLQSERGQIEAEYENIANERKDIQRERRQLQHEKWVNVIAEKISMDKCEVLSIARSKFIELVNVSS